MKTLSGTVVVFLISTVVLFAPARAGAATEEGDRPEDEQYVVKSSGTDWGLNVDIGVASAYVFRGLNIFKDDDQRNQNMLLAPGLSWSILDTGLTLGYWSAYQLTGNNIGANVDSGIGAEQDLYALYEITLKDRFNLSAWFFYYFFPAADEDVAGVSNPSYVEPGVSAGISAGIDVNIDFVYFLGAQDALRDLSYFYIHPHIGKSIAINKVVSLDLAFGYGFKVWKDSSVVDNTHDILFSIALPIEFSYGFYLTPTFAVAWTNLEPVPVDPEDHPHLPLGNLDDLKVQPHKAVVWGGVNVGVNL